MTIFEVLTGLCMVVGTCAAIALAATLGMVGMARLERAAIPADPPRRSRALPPPR